VIFPTEERQIKSVIALWELSKQALSISVDAMDFVHAVLEDFNSGDIEHTLQKEHKK